MGNHVGEAGIIDEDVNLSVVLENLRDEPIGAEISTNGALDVNRIWQRLRQRLAGRE